LDHPVDLLSEPVIMHCFMLHGALLRITHNAQSQTPTGMARGWARAHVSLEKDKNWSVENSMRILK